MKTPEERYATAMENFPELVVVRENLFRVMDLLELPHEHDQLYSRLDESKNALAFREHAFACFMSCVQLRVQQFWTEERLYDYIDYAAWLILESEAKDDLGEKMLKDIIMMSRAATLGVQTVPGKPELQA